METELMPKQPLHRTAVPRVGLRCEYLRNHWFSKLGRGALLTLAVLLSSDLAAWAEVVAIRPALIETAGGISVEYRSGSTLIGRSTEAAPVGVEILLPEIGRASC